MPRYFLTPVFAFATTIGFYGFSATAAVINIAINEQNGSVIVNGTTEINNVTVGRTCDTTTHPGFLTCTVALPGGDSFPFADLLFDQPLNDPDTSLSDIIRMTGANTFQFASDNNGAEGMTGEPDAGLDFGVPTGFTNPMHVREQANGPTGADVTTLSGNNTVHFTLAADLPEPSTFTLMALGFVAMTCRCFWRRRNLVL